jgi:hypothetical protein
MSARMCGPERLVVSSGIVGPSLDRDWVEM